MNAWLGSEQPEYRTPRSLNVSAVVVAAVFAVLALACVVAGLATGDTGFGVPAVVFLGFAVAAVFAEMEQP